MNATKLGLRLTSPVLATALVLAPISPALAAPPDEEGESDAEGTEAEGEAPEGEEGGEIEIGGDEEGGEIEIGGDEEGEGEPAEGEEGEEGGEIEIGGDEEGEGEPAEGEDLEAEEGEGDEIAVGGDEEGEDIEEVPEPELTPEGPLRPPEPTWGPKDQYPMNGKGMLITGGIVTGLGAAFILTSVLITRCDFDSALSCKYGDQRDFLVPTAVATTGLGLLLVGVGVGNHIKYKRWQNWTPEQTAVVPTMVPGGGGGLAWVGRF